MTKDMMEKLDRAQMVLVGVGKEMEEDDKEMGQLPFYRRLLEAAEEEESPEVIRQYIRLHYLTRHGKAGEGLQSGNEDGRTRHLAAYRRLAELLEGKNYFIVSLCTDDLIYEAGLDESRIVTPCGGYRALQCMETDEEGRPLCHTDQELLVTDSQVWEQVLSELDRSEGELSKVDFPVCAECGRLLAFNQMGTPGYCEEGYLPQWEKYKLWLQGTLNKELCVLELGVGMEYPMVIRFPFEKVVFFNQKASLFRVHSRLYQMTEELKGRGIPVEADPVDFLLEDEVRSASGAADGDGSL